MLSFPKILLAMLAISKSFDALNWQEWWSNDLQHSGLHLHISGRPQYEFEECDVVNSLTTSNGITTTFKNCEITVRGARRLYFPNRLSDVCPFNRFHCTECVVETDNGRQCIGQHCIESGEKFLFQNVTLNFVQDPMSGDEIEGFDSGYDYFDDFHTPDPVPSEALNDHFWTHAERIGIFGANRTLIFSSDNTTNTTKNVKTYYYALVFAEDPHRALLQSGMKRNVYQCPYFIHSCERCFIPAGRSKGLCLGDECVAAGGEFRFLKAKFIITQHEQPMSQVEL